MNNLPPETVGDAPAETPKQEARRQRRAQLAKKRYQAKRQRQLDEAARLAAEQAEVERAALKIRSAEQAESWYRDMLRRKALRGEDLFADLRELGVSEPADAIRRRYREERAATIAAMRAEGTWPEEGEILIATMRAEGTLPSAPDTDTAAPAA